MSKLIIWIIISYVCFWCIKEKHFMHCYIKRKKKKVTRNKNILTYNIQRLPWSLKPIYLLRNIVRSHSIVFLQECYSNVLYDEIQHAFHEYNIVKGTLSRYALINSGLIILTLFPVLSHIFVPFHVQDYLSTDILSEKGFLVVEIKINGTIYYIINTHLQSSTNNWNNIVSMRQLQQLLSYAETLSHPYVIGGDFNIDYEKLPQNIKRKINIYNPDQPTIYIKYENGCEVDTSCIKKDGYTPFCFDYFIVNDMILKKSSVLHFEYSDHLPVHSAIIS